MSKSTYNWQCVGNISVPLARINSDVACMSTDGDNCLWDTCQGKKMVGSVPSNLKPNVCNQTEYATEDHWCAQGKKLLNDSNLTLNDKNANPVRPKVTTPDVRSRNRRSTGDYFYYVIDLIVSIIAITIALISTIDEDYTVRLTHIVLAILFRYIYLGFMIINKGRSLFFYNFNV